MLKVNDHFGKTIGGTTLEKHLRAELEAFSKSATGAVLLGPVLGGAGSFEVVIKAGAPTATAGTRVTINPKETNIASASSSDDLKEFVESTIFELTNASKAEQFADLEMGLENGTIPLREYGKRKASDEADATWRVSQILKERKGYEPSDWGKAQIKATGSKSFSGFTHEFCALAHELGTPSTDPASLPSADYYAFNGAWTLGGKLKKLDNHFTVTHKTANKRVSLHKLKAKAPNASSINAMNIKAATYYWVVVDILKSNKSLNVSWRHPADKYEFSEAMKAIAPDTGDTFRTAFDKALATPAADILG